MAGLANGEYCLMDIHTSTPRLQNQSGRSASRAYPFTTGGRINKLNALFFSLGALINVFSYLSLSPVIVSTMFYALTHVLLSLTKLGGQQRFACLAVFTV